jgi:hypothetical protein
MKIGRDPAERSKIKSVRQNDPVPVVLKVQTIWRTPDGEIEGSEQLFVLMWGSNGLIWQV